jgi:ABC-type branched-subunit amino acid transport system substrate-binding protein
VRALALLAAILVSCTTPPVVLPTTAPTREPGVLRVTVLLNLSGPGGLSGQAQRNAMQLWVDEPSTAPVKLRVKFVDVVGSDTKLLLELRRAVVDDGADALVIGVPMSVADPTMNAIGVGGAPTLLTLPIAEPAAAPGGTFAFALAPSPEQIAQTMASDLVTRGIVQPMLLASDGSRAAVSERTAFVAALARRAIVAPSAVDLETPDGPQRVRAAAAFAKSVVLTGASAPYGDVIRSIPVTNDAPRVYLSYLTETADVTNLRDQSALVTWPGSRGIVGTPFGGTGFFQRFTDRYGAPSTIAATAYDALGMIQQAASAAPNETDGARLRQRLEATTFGGVVTRYSFSSTRHLGFSTADLTLLRWSAQTGRALIAARAIEPV